MGSHGGAAPTARGRVLASANEFRSTDDAFGLVRLATALLAMGGAFVVLWFTLAPIAFWLPAFFSVAIAIPLVWIGHDRVGACVLLASVLVTYRGYRANATIRRRRLSSPSACSRCDRRR